MTTKVTIKAEVHNQEKEVRVNITHTSGIVTSIFLKSGEETEQYVYDGQTIAVCEVDCDDDGKYGQGCT